MCKLLRHGQGIDRTGNHTEPTKNAPGKIESIFFGKSSFRKFGMNVSNNTNCLCRTDGFAEIAPDATLLSIFISAVNDESSVSIRQFKLLMRVLNSNFFLNIWVKVSFRPCIISVKRTLFNNDLSVMGSSPDILRLSPNHINNNRRHDDVRE